jgi:hypothetical protein
MSVQKTLAAVLVATLLTVGTVPTIAHARGRVGRAIGHRVAEDVADGLEEPVAIGLGVTTAVLVILGGALCTISTPAAIAR